MVYCTHDLDLGGRANMTRISFWQPAGTFDVPGKGEFPQQFGPHAWDGQIGRQVPLTDGGGREISRCTLVGAQVDEDGGGVTLMIEVPDDFPADCGVPVQGMSFAFRDPDPDLEFHNLAPMKPPRITWKP
jgi:hypothetical protein